MKEKVSFTLIVAMACLVAGNLVGAGILALPVNTGLAGLVPALLGMIVVGAGMFVTALILSGEAVRERESTFNYPSLYSKYLGVIGKWVAILANLLILYGLLTAYLTGAATIINNLFKFPLSLGLLAFFVLMTGLTVTGIKFVQRYNMLMMLLMWASFAVIVIMGETHASAEHLRFTDWRFLPATVPIIVTSFHFHNIIPQICHGLKWNRAAIWKAILVGMAIGYVMNAIWIQVAIGVLNVNGGSNSLMSAYNNSLPATVPMANILHSKMFNVFALLFALLAITTSYLTNGTGLMGFIRDLTENHFKTSNKWLIRGLSFGPPAIIALVYPDIFLKALNVVGGVGIVLLFGILPGIIGLIKVRKPLARATCLVILVLFAGALVIEVCQETGVFKLKPETEYYDHHVGQKTSLSSETAPDK